MTTFEPSLGDPRGANPSNYKGFVLAFFTTK